MEDFKTYENAEKLFAENNCFGTDNCIFIARKDANQAGAQAGMSSTMGLVGSALAGARAKGDALKNIYFDSFLNPKLKKLKIFLQNGAKCKRFPPHKFV